MDDQRHDIGLVVMIYRESEIEPVVNGNVSKTCAAGNIYDEEANALRMAEQMVREAFRRRRVQLGLQN